MERKKLGDFVLLALFVALIVLLGFTPLGLIPLGFINVTILCVPVIVGALYMGWKNGLLLGLAFGLTSFISALMKPSTLVSTLMGASPVLVALMSILPRLLVPIGLLWRIYAPAQQAREPGRWGSGGMRFLDQYDILSGAHAPVLCIVRH